MVFKQQEKQDPEAPTTSASEVDRGIRPKWTKNGQKMNSK